MMRTLLLFILATMTSIIIWAALVYTGTNKGWLRQSIAPTGDAQAFVEASINTLNEKYNGNAAFVYIENGRVAGEHFISINETIDENTLFQVGSLSKWVAAWGVMTLVEEGKLDLDTPVSQYLTRWQLPESDFDNEAVTVRRLLSHTAGLTDGLGYAGFAPDGTIQTLEQSLTQAADASPGADGKVRVGIEPGSQFEYSGGGYTLLQLLVEEVSGKSFASYMQHAVFTPLKMQRSTYLYPENSTPNLANSYDTDGSQATRFRFTGLAPTALYTSAEDMTVFLQAHIESASGAPAGRGVLSPQTLNLMRDPHASTMGADIWGLGTILYAPNANEGFIIGHDGNDEPAINSAVRLNPATGNGIVVLETGNELLATTMAGDWVFWETGTIDFLTFSIVAEGMITLILIGSVVIIILAIFLGLVMRQRAR